MSILSILFIATQSCLNNLFSSGGESNAIWGGNTSGTPPTSVDTTSNPQQAASRIAIQNDSVSDVFKNMWPLQSASRTSECLSPPSSSILSCNSYLSRSYTRRSILSPSPPIIKWTFLYNLSIFGIIPIRRSTPFRYYNRDTNTMLIMPGGSLSRIEKSG